MINIRKLRRITTRQDKIFLFILFLLSVGLSFIETVGISAIMPFISVATNPSLIAQNSYSKAIYDAFGFASNNAFVLAFGVVLIVFYIFRAFYTIFYTYLLNKFAFGRYRLFAQRLFAAFLDLPYKRFVRRNSSDLTKTIVGEAQNLSLYLQNFLNLFSEIFTIILLYALLLLVNWKMTLVLTIFLGLKVFFITKLISKKIKEQGKNRATTQSRFFGILTESFGNFKLIKLIQNQAGILKNFQNAAQGYSKALITNATLNVLPRNILETLGFGVLITIVLYTLLRYDDASLVLSTISMYALALYRMLPAVNRILSSYNSMLFYGKALDIIYKELRYTPPAEGENKIDFNDKITLKNIAFSYTRRQNVLENLSLSIKKGSKIAFIGESGSGKSTLVDLIIGIYRPDFGSIFIDDTALDEQNIRSWRKKIGYIPQSIYLFDGTVADNVAFGYEIDENRIIDCLKKANIWHFLEEKNGINTLVGEGGIQLSGGQKQRIGIARALYSDPEILVLDEATSALDDDTEARIMDEIYSAAKGRTLIIIAHRLSTTERCDTRIRLEKGKIISVE